MARILPHWIDAYLRYTSNTEAPEAFHFWTALATLAGAVERKVYINMTQFEWPPNSYIVLVGQAGLVTKSTSLRIGEKLLRAVGPKIKFGSNSGSWQAMMEEISRTRKMVFASKTPGMSTTDKLRENSGWGMSAISYFISELGTFLSPDNREQLDFFVDAWDGQRGIFTRTTKVGGEVSIETPCVNILAATTPVWIKENFTPTMIGGGFASRLIFILGKAKRQLIPYPSLLTQPDEHERMKQDLIHDLKHISNIEGEVRLSPEAINWGERWYYNHNGKLTGEQIAEAKAAGHEAIVPKRQLSGERFDGFYARKQTHLHKLAMILSIAESDRLVIEARHLMEANEHLLSVEKNLAFIMDNISNKQISALHKREMLSIINEGPIDRDDLYKQLYQMMSGTDFDRHIGDLAKAHQISIQPKGGKTWLTMKDLRVVVGRK